VSLYIIRVGLDILSTSQDGTFSLEGTDSRNTPPPGHSRFKKKKRHRFGDVGLICRFDHVEARQRVSALVPSHSPIRRRIFRIYSKNTLDDHDVRVDRYHTYSTKTKRSQIMHSVKHHGSKLCSQKSFLGKSQDSFPTVACMERL
jgi:hypothetical protein